MKTPAPGQAERQKHDLHILGKKPAPPSMEHQGAGSATPRAPRIQLCMEEGSGPQGPGVSLVAAGRTSLGGQEKPLRVTPTPPRPPPGHVVRVGRGRAVAPAPRNEASPSPSPLHPGLRPPSQDSPWIPRGPGPPLPASRRTTRGKKEEAPADSAIVTTAAAAAAAAQQRPARARAPPAPPLLPRPGSRLPLLRPAPARALPAEPAPRPPRAPPKGGAGCARAPALKGSVPVKGVGGVRLAPLSPLTGG